MMTGFRLWNVEGQFRMYVGPVTLRSLYHRLCKEASLYDVDNYVDEYTGAQAFIFQTCSKVR